MKNLLKLLLPVLLVGVLLSACSNKTGQISEALTGIEIKIEGNQFLTVSKGEEKYYVTSELGSDFSHGKDLGGLVKDDGKIIFVTDRKPIKGQTAIIHGLDFDQALISINGENYKLATGEINPASALNIDGLFNDLVSDRAHSLTLNPNNFEEFIDQDNNLYKIGDQVGPEEAGWLTGPVTLKGEDI